VKIEFTDGEDRWMPAVTEFFQRCYTPSYRLAVDRSLFEWQFGGVSPSPGRYHLKLAVRGATVLASLGFVPVELSVAGRIVRAAWTANWMVDPEQRRLGLGPLLLKQLMTEYDAVLSVGLERDAVELLPRMGWVDFGDLRRYVLVLDAAATAQLSGSPAAPSGALESGAPEAAGSGQARLTEVLDEAATALWDRLQGAHGAGTRRSAAFLRWRYLQHPVFAYHVFASPADGATPNGVLVYRIEKVRDMPVWVGRIVELVAEPEAVTGLLTAAVAHARAANVALVDFFCASSRFDGALAAAGFLPGQRAEVKDVPLLFQPVNRARTGIRFMGYLSKLPAGSAGLDWYVTKGDGDQDRPN
jgi:hypothetical protein